MIMPLPFPESDHPLHLLVVDDQAFDRAMICTRIREVAPENTIVVDVANGEETLAAIREATIPFDCVLLDMNLPDIHGVELVSMIHALKPELSIVMVTIEADMDKALTCLKAGAQDFLIKGEYSNIGLYRSVRYAIERHRAAIENMRLKQDLARERELSAAQKDFIHLVSHEFRTPIAIISGAMQLLAAKAPELREGVGAPQFKKVDSAISRLIGLLDNVLRLSLVEDGKEVFTPTMFDIRAAIDSVAECFDAARIQVAKMENPVHYLGDQRLMEYALHNVIGNAAKFSPADSPIRVRLIAIQQAIEIIVTDEGPGMSPEMIARAGEKFYRDSATSHIEGTGLGLHLARRFIEYHRGHLIFESSKGQGTTVRMVFPYEAALVEAV
jgi:signal transduction histidine kinase